MNEHLLDYVLDRLDDSTKRQVESRLEVDEAARRHVESLRQTMALLAADEDTEPPSHLSARTIARVAEYACRQLPQAPAPRRSESASRPWWRRADVLVAASLLAMVAGIGLPMLSKLRNPAAIVECQENLRKFYFALHTYQEQHKQLPAIDQKDVAGVIIPMLRDAGCLPEDFSVRCPGHGDGTFQTCSLTVQDIKAMTPEQIVAHAPNLLASYAFTLGYRDENNIWHPLNRADDGGDNSVLIFADSPPPGITAGNSRNHAGRGQNVLFLDGRVQFLSVRTFAGDDIYLNTTNCVAAGNSVRDHVLGGAGAKP
jgi:hypothetical protein